MTLTLDDVREILEAEYYRDNINFLFERLFSDFRQSDVLIDIPSKFEEIRQIGESSSIDIKVYEVKLSKDIENQRVGITNEMFKILKGLNEYNAIVVFVNPDKNNYRLSLLTTSFVNSDGIIKKEFSNPHRYSYYLGKGTKTKTVYEFLYAKGSVKSLEELKDRFSIDIVNKDFYSKIAESFTKLIGGNFSGTKYPRLLRFSQDVPVNKYSEFGVRLLGRLIFCWFLKEKKSDSGKPLVPDILFDDDLVNQVNVNYYNDVLQTLFFETLNTPWDIRKESVKNNEYFKFIPYLNGGLFSPHLDDFYNGLGSQNVYIPNSWFDELFVTLKQYNFTVDESTSYDVELSIDPEMLGRIFENLLAEINPETGESARKSTGSFYTPRDIVEFMVNSSLYEHLNNTTSVEPFKIETLIEYGDNDEVTFSKIERQEIVDSLYGIKILDPACGSGAFPMGLLQKIVYILQEIDPDNILWLDKIEKDETIDEETKKQIQWSSIDYARKLLVIKNSIYGVDIQPIAAEISRLRCFLSIIIEEKIDDNLPNRGVRPLPNLDFNFVIGNTLIPLEKSGEQFSLFDDYDAMEELNSIREQWFTANPSMKTKLRGELAGLQSSMALDALTNRNYESEKYKRLLDWNPSSSDENDWFDCKWMFGIDEFDIVIGNPPYIQLQKGVISSDGKKKESFGNMYKDYAFQTYDKTGDIYCLFYEEGINLLKSGGILCYITSNKWLRSGYGKKLRDLLSKYNPLLLLDFSGEKIFNSATVDVNVLVCQKNKNNGKTHCCEMANFKGQTIGSFVQKNNIQCSFMNSENWIILDSVGRAIMDKVKSKGTPLEKWGIRMFRGILTGNNSTFILDEAKRRELIKADSNCEKLIRPILRGRDMHRFTYDFENIYLLNIHNGVPKKGIPRVDVNKYPVIKQYLDKNYNSLKNRYDQGDTPYNLRGCAYLDDFSKPKIMCGFVVDRLSFCYVPDEVYCLDPAYFLQAGDYNKYLLACLNSNLIDWYYKMIGEQIGSGNILLLADTLERIPIPKISQSELDNFNELIDNATKSKFTENDIKKIDSAIYNLYGLDEKEVNYVQAYYKK